MLPYCGARKTRQASLGSPPCKCPHTCSRTKSDYKQFKKYLYASGMSSHEGTRQVHVRWESDWPPSPMLAQGRQNEAMRKVCSICLLYLPARLTMFAMKFRPAQILILLVLLCLLTSSMFAQGPVILSADGQTDTYTLLDNTLGGRRKRLRIAAILLSARISPRPPIAIWENLFLSFMSTL